MDFKLVSLACLLSIIATVSGLSCIKCLNTESYGMCMKYRDFVECESWEDRCHKASVDTWYEGKPVRMFGRGCASANDCVTRKKLDVCKGGPDENIPLENHCDVFCCSGDYCNSATLPVVSGLILAACALIVAFLL